MLRACVLFSALIATPGLADARPLPGVPERGPKPESFAPKGWSVESTLAADLDGDPIPDAIVIVLETGGEDRHRALIWLHGTPDGFVRVATNRGLVASLNGLGMKGGEAAPELEVKKRVLTVTQWGGSRESYGAVHRFRWEKGGVKLIGVDHSQMDSLTGESSTSSTNLLTGVTVTEIQPAQVTEDDKPTHAKPRTTRKKEPRSPLPNLEEVEEYAKDD